MPPPESQSSVRCRLPRQAVAGESVAWVLTLHVIPEFWHLLLHTKCGHQLVHCLCQLKVMTRMDRILHSILKVKSLYVYVVSVQGIK